LEYGDAWISIAERELGLMEVTEHNLYETDLSLKDINELIRLVKEESHNHKDNRTELLYYGVLIGKLVCLRHDLM
jgi:hypothetical protein